jgi:5'(3')-deoxyribonucleotidase
MFDAPGVREHRPAIEAECHQPGFCRNLKPFPGALQGINNLREIADVYAVTSHMKSETWVYERDAWLAEHLQFERNDIIHAHKKWLVTGDVLIDDKPKHIDQWTKFHKNGLGVLWAWPHNLKPGLDHHGNWIRTNHWDTVFERCLLIAAAKTTKTKTLKAVP